MRIADLETPALILDQAVLERNCAAMAERAKRHGVRLRPHIKTAKSAEVAAIATRGQFGGLTVYSRRSRLLCGASISRFDVRRGNCAR